METPKYNLLHEPWIPCELSGGSTVKLGLWDVLARAHEIIEIYDPSPLVTTSLHRLLIVLMYRCVPASSDEDFDSNWKTLWESPTLPTGNIERYFAQWSERFSLFDENYPFYQTPSLSVVQEDKQGNLQEHPDSIFRLHNDTPDVALSYLFEHRQLSQDSVVIPVDEAARLLVATQSYGISCSQSGRYTFNGETKHDPGGRQNGLLYTGLVCWLAGQSLKETLLLNWTRYVCPELDMPCWERNDYAASITSSQGKGNEHIPRGMLDRFTWQARMARLIPTYQYGNLAVSQIHFTQGRQARKAVIRDEMQFYIRDSKGEVESVLQLRRDKAGWRNIHSLLLFSSLKQNDTRPAVIRQVSERIEYGELNVNTRRYLQLHVTGHSNDKAKTVLWRHDFQAIPVRLIADPNLSMLLGRLMSEAEDMSNILQRKTEKLCQVFLCPKYFDMDGEPINKPPERKKWESLSRCIDPRPAYWARLESVFQRLLLHIADDEGDASEVWRKALDNQARIAFSEAASQLGDSVRAIKAEALASVKTKTRKGRTA
ncbi:MAG: type I-E CRISPR-associated protein Cse1/CasA [Armatimonadetes bacterium]|nr:type I-E CRISPR-associated protein Cse1/CasA [Armatimonadota bacterium]